MKYYYKDPNEDVFVFTTLKKLEQAVVKSFQSAVDNNDYKFIESTVGRGSVYQCDENDIVDWFPLVNFDKFKLIGQAYYEAFAIS